MQHRQIVSDHIRDDFSSHHIIVKKDEDGIRGAATNWFGGVPTIDGFADLGRIKWPLTEYVIGLWQMDPERERNRPTLIVATPKNSRHCSWIGDMIVSRLSSTNGPSPYPRLVVKKHELAELNSLEAPYTKLPPEMLDRATQKTVARFTSEFDEWEAGDRVWMPDPRAVGSSMSVREHLARANRGQRILAGMTMAHGVLKVLTSTGVYFNNAVMGEHAEKALATGIFPATPIKFGYAHIYRYPAYETAPVRLTAEPVRLSDIMPPGHTAYATGIPNELPNEPFV